jgi:hypothetical protein
MENLFGADYTSSTPPYTALKRQGIRFVCRYLAPNHPTYHWKRLTKPEVKAIKAAGMGLVTVWESSAGRALAGYNAGKVDAQDALAHLKEVGAPAGVVVYFAVDFDTTEAQQKPINDYFHGVKDVLGLNRVGVYGSYYVVKRLFNAGLVTYGWQTYAWSGGQWEPRAQLRQYKNGQRIGGLSCDYDRAVVADFGQWGGHPKPKPVPKPKAPARYIVIADGEVLSNSTALPGRLLNVWNIQKKRPAWVEVWRIDV